MNHTASSGTGTSIDELQNRYCGGVLSATTNAAADDSIIGYRINYIVYLVLAFDENQNSLYYKHFIHIQIALVHGR